MRLHCEELELQAGEQEAVLREMEVAMQRLALDADRRLTQQHREHQNNIQLLLQKLKGEGLTSAWTKQFECDFFFCPIPLQKFNKYCCFIYFCVCVFQRVVQERYSRQSKTDCSIWRKSCFSTKAPVGSSKRKSKSFSVMPCTQLISPHIHRSTNRHTVCRHTHMQTNPRHTLKRCRQGHTLQQHTQRYTLSKQTKRHTTFRI